MALAAYTRYRIYVTKASAGSKGWTAINEFGLFEDSDHLGPNLCTGAIVTASHQNGTYVAANAIDGNPSTAWESDGSATDKWLAVQLPEAKVVRSFYLSQTIWASETPRNFLIQGSNNGTNWTTLAEFVDFATGNYTGYTSINLSIGGVSKLDTGNPSLRVLVHNWTTGQLVASIIPAADGAWNYRPRSTADLLVTHIGPSGYRPISDGPITPYAE